MNFCCDLLDVIAYVSYYELFLRNPYLLRDSNKLLSTPYI